MKKKQSKALLIELLLTSIKELEEKSDLRTKLLDVLHPFELESSILEKLLNDQTLMDEVIPEMLKDDILSKLEFEKEQNNQVSKLSAYKLANPNELSDEKKKEIFRDLITRIRLDPKDWKDVRIRLDEDWERNDKIRLGEGWDDMGRIRLGKDWEKNLGVNLEDIRIDPNWNKKR